MMPETYRNGYNAFVYWNLNGGGISFMCTKFQGIWNYESKVIA